jgi:hypothetical protein
VVVLGPCPNNPNPMESFNVKTDFGLVWYVRPPSQLFFNCTLCPTGAKGDSSTHNEVSLVYFSTSEPIQLTLDTIMQQPGVPMLYDSASNPRLPYLYICPVANVLGRAPLIPCFIGSNRHPTIPHRFKDDWRLGDASADTQGDRGNGSRPYEVNIWMLRYGRGRPPDGFCRRGGEDPGRVSQGEQVEGGRDEEASHRGRCSGGCRRRRRSGLNKLAYDIIYDIKYDMILDFM